MVKKIDKYMAMSYRMEIIEDEAEGGYVVFFPELPGCITCGETIESAIMNAKDAKRAWLESEIESGADIPKPESTEDYLNQVRLQIPKNLQKTLIEHAGMEGVSTNRYCVDLLTKGDAAYAQSKK